MNIVEELNTVFGDVMLKCEAVKSCENERWGVFCIFWIFNGEYSVSVINKDNGKMAMIDNLDRYAAHRAYDEMCELHGLA